MIEPVAEIPRNPEFMSNLNRLGGDNMLLYNLLEDEVLPSTEQLRDQINEHLRTL